MSENSNPSVPQMGRITKQTSFYFIRFCGGCHKKGQQNQVCQSLSQPKLLCQGHDGEWGPQDRNLCQETDTSRRGTVL